MAAKRDVDVIVRLAVDGDDLDKKLTPSAKKAQKAIDDLASTAKKTNPALAALDDTVNIGAAGFEEYARQIPIVGDALVALGPIGIAAGVALSAVTAAAVIALNAGAQAAREIAEIGDAAEDIGLATDAYQALVFVTAGQRQEQGELNTLLKTASKNLGEVVFESGEFYSNIKLLNPELVKQVAEVDTLEDRLNLVAKAYQNASSETERQQLASRTFGDSNLKLAKTFLTVEGGLDGAIIKAREFGAVQSDSLIAAAQIAATELELADLRITASRQRLGIVFADEAAGMKSAWAGFIDFISTQQGIIPEGSFDQQIKDLKARRLALEDERQEIFATSNTNGLFGAYSREEIRVNERLITIIEADIRALTLWDAATKESIAIQIEQQEKQKEAGAVLIAFNRLTEEAKTKANHRAEAEKALQNAIEAKLITDEKEITRLRKFIAEKYKNVEAIRASAKALKEFERRSKQVADVQSRLGDVAAKVAIKEKQLNDIRAAGIRAGDKNVLTLQQISASLTDYERRLSGAAAAEKRLTSSFEKSLAPLARYLADKQKLLDLQKLANIDAEKFNAILEAREQLYRDEIKAANDAKEREQFGETLADAEKRILNALKTSEQVIDAKIALQKKILEALGDEISDADAARYLKEYREELEKVGKETDKVAKSQNDWDRILDKQIRSWDDLKDVALSALQEIIKQLILGQKESEGFGGFLNSIFGGSSGSGIFTPGINGDAGDGSSGSDGGFLSGIIDSIGSFFGGSAEATPIEKAVSNIVNDNIAPKSGTNNQIPSLPNQAAAPVDLTAAIRAASQIIARPATPTPAANSGAVKLSVKYDGQPADVEAEDKGLDAEGVRQIEIRMMTIGKAATKQVLADGSADTILSNRFGIYRAARRR